MAAPMAENRQEREECGRKKQQPQNDEQDGADHCPRIRRCGSYNTEDKII